MTAPTALPADTDVCGCGRLYSSHYADLGRMRGPGCPDFHPVCTPTCNHPKLRNRALPTVPTTVQLAPRTGASHRYIHPDAVVPSHLREERLPPEEVPDEPAPPPRPAPAAAPAPRATAADDEAPLTGLAAQAEAAAVRILETPAAVEGPPAGPTTDSPVAVVEEVAAGQAVPAATPEAPRRRETRPAEPSALVSACAPAVVGGGGAGTEVADDEPPAGVATSVRAGDAGLGRATRALIARRQALDLSQVQVAARMGVTSQYVNSLENGRRGAGSRVLAAWADALGMNAEIVLTDKHAPPPEPRSPFDLNQVWEHAEFMYQAWWCGRCRSRRFDPGACPVCKRALQPVHVAILPRETE